MSAGHKQKVIRHTFSTVDAKVAETEFFLRKMAEVYMDSFSFNCYFSAYLSASRTTTLALQQFKHIPGFDRWYEPHRQRLKADKLAKFFLDTRNSHVHGGPYPVTRGQFHLGDAAYYFDQSVALPSGNPEDVVSVCRDYFVSLLEVVYDCYVNLGAHIDPQQYYTKENFAKNRRCIDDAEIEIYGWICTSLIEKGWGEDDRWHELRANVGECEINHLFYSYLGAPTPQPEVPDYILDFEYTPEERGWVHVPAGFTSIEDYIVHRRALTDVGHSSMG